MQENNTTNVGTRVIANGILQAIYHYILAVQIENKCCKADALVKAGNLLDEMKEILKEAKDGLEGTSGIHKENS